MGLLEWFSEPYNPGPTGSIDVGSDEPDDDGEPPKRWMIWLTILIGLGLSGIGLYWVFYDIGYTGWRQILLKLCCLVVYVLISYTVTPRPDYTNVGWLGGLVDNPFRISDDYNRWLIYSQALLFPGKLIAYALIMSWYIGRYVYKKMMKRT